MTLTMTKTTTGYIVEGTDAVGKDVELFFDSNATSQYDYLVEVEENFHKQTEFEEKRKQLPDPERDLYLSIFGKGEEHTDTVLHSTLVEAQEARDGIAIDWSVNPVTAVLRLIAKGESNRLRLIAGSLVDMGPTVSAGAGSQAGPVAGDVGSVEPDDNSWIG